METIGLNNPKLLGDDRDPDGPPIPLTSDTKTLEDLKPTPKGVENAKKRLRAFSIQKKSSLSPIPLPKPICTTVGAIGTVFIGKLASSKPALKPGGIEEVPDPKKPPKPPKPGTSKLQNADYLNIQKKTLSEIEDMKRKMELVDLGIPLGLICPTPDSDKAMPTKAMPPIKSMMLDPAKVDEIIREAKKARAEGKSFKFSYEKLLPSYQNPFAKKDKDKERERERDREATLPDDSRQSRDKRRHRRYSSHKDDKRGRDWHSKDYKELTRARVIREREDREYRMKKKSEKSKKDVKSNDNYKKSKKKDVKPQETETKVKDKIDTINLSDEDEEVQEIIDSAHEVSEKNVKETDVNLKDFVICDSWSETEEKPIDPSQKDDKRIKKKPKTTPIVKHIDPMEQLKQSLIKDAEPPVEVIVKKLHPVTDSFKFEIDDNDDEEPLDIFAENTSLEKFAKHIPLPKEKSLYDSPIAIKFDHEAKDASIDAMDESFLESVIAEIKQEDIDDDTAHDKGLVEYDSPKDYERESVTPELDDKIRQMYSNRGDDYSDGFKSVESVKSTESGFKSNESGYKSTESGYKSTEDRKSTSNRSKSIESNISIESHKSSDSRSKSTESHKMTESDRKPIQSDKSTKSGYKSTDDRKSTSSRSKSIESNISIESHKSSDSRSKSTESHKLTESDLKPIESDCKPTDSGVKSTERSTEPARTEEMAKSTVDSLETWSFVLKICQPLLFRHDKNKCYKETRDNPKIWYAENPKLCDCVKDRSVVYEELEMCKMEIVDNVYGSNLAQDAIYPEARGWYQANFLAESGSVLRCSEWEVEDSQEPPTPPHSRDEMVLDREYQKFMEAVWPDVEGKSETPRSTPVRDVKKRPGDDTEIGNKKKMKIEGKMSSEGWSQESEVEEEAEKQKKSKGEKIKRKRKHSPSNSDSEEVSPSKKKKKLQKKEKGDKSKYKTKRQRLSKKYLKKLKEKQLKKKKKLAKMELDSENDETEKEKKKKDKKQKKKKLLKQKKKNQKKKSKKSSSSSSDSESERKSKKKDKRKKKKRKQSSSESNQSDEVFDVNILKNIKTERLTDDEKAKHFSPNKKHREIINVKQLQNDFVSIQIKKEIEDVNSPEEFKQNFTEEKEKEMSKVNSPKEFEESFTEEEKKEMANKEVEKELEKKEIEERVETKEAENIEVKVVGESIEVKVNQSEVAIFGKQEHEFKEPERHSITPQPKPVPEENLSQCSSQESIISSKEQPYEKDDSHLRPSSQNSNYNFHDVMQSEGHEISQNELYEKGIGMEMEGDYEQGNYEMYEQMAMEYQSDVASQRVPPPDEQTSGRIETVVRTRNRGEIKCDWRAGDPSDPTASAAPTALQRPSRWGDAGEGHEAPVNTTPQRPSRWGLKPSEVNIVLTGGSEGEQSETYPIVSVVAPVYKIQSLANRTDNNSNSGYDEAYMDMYGASDRLQYGDCFSRETTLKEVEKKPPTLHSSSLDDRINLALRTTILGDVAKDDTQDEDGPDKGILVTKSLAETRNVKRVSFADGYKPGQDSDTEEPPVRKIKKARRLGCPWPCPASHPDHVSLWDALPPPPPPAGSPPPPAPPRAPPTHLLRTLRPAHSMLPQPPHHMAKFDPSSLTGFMPPEPPPGLISF